MGERRRYKIKESEINKLSNTFDILLFDEYKEDNRIKKYWSSSDCTGRWKIASYGCGMFNLINIGERAGSGVPNIFNVWADEGWQERRCLT